METFTRHVLLSLLILTDNHIHISEQLVFEEGFQTPLNEIKNTVSRSAILIN